MKFLRSATVILLGLAGAVEAGQVVAVDSDEVNKAADAFQALLVVLTFFARFRKNAGQPINSAQEAR